MTSPSSAPTRLTYRPDVDGLRAVAVLSVIGFHARFTFIPGGFVGVDVFFVISGYLISAIIMREINQDRFSILAFYERRIRRIFPAMLAMFFVVTLLACYYLLPSEVMAYARSLLAALFSVSNFLFWKQVGYFDMASAFKPLLHTWSLAVEEQFYLLFPPFLLLLRKFAPRYTKLAIIVITVLSFIASVYVVPRSSAAAFYFTPLRAWELLLGAILSQHYLPALRHAFARHIASIAGIVMILGAVFFFRESTPFPGLGAVPPCLGAALIIAAGETGPSIVGRVLAWRPIVFIGLISYSLYLWHWPVIVFQNTNNILVPSRYAGKHITGPVMVVVSIALAILSWAFVERPFRTGAMRMSRRALFQVSGAAVAVLVAVGVGLILAHGLPQRYSPDALQIANRIEDSVRVPWREDVCFITPTSSFPKYKQDLCLAQHPGQRSLLLMGDSHAASLYPGLKAAFPDRDVMQANASACRGLLHEPASQSRTCRLLFYFIFSDFLLHHHVDTLVFAGRWVPADYDALGRTIAWAHQHGFQVVIVGRNPEYDAPLPRLMATALRTGDPDLVAQHYSTAPVRVDQEMAALSRDQWHVPYVSFFDAFCKPDCPTYAAPQAPMLMDGAHLTMEGGAMFSQAVRARIQSLDADPTSNVPR